MRVKYISFAVCFLSLLLLAGSASSAGAIPAEQWNRTFGNIEYDCGNSVRQTQDGGYILAGETVVNYDEANADALLMKLNPDGIEEWSRTFGGPAYDCAYSVQQTADGGYVLAGYLEKGEEIDSRDPDSRDPDAWLIKTNSNGTEEWNFTFGGNKTDLIFSVEKAIDGGYLLAGYTESFGAGASDAWLIKTDSNGTEQWNKTFGGINEDYASSVNQSKDGGYVISGFTNSSAGENEAWLIKTDSNGTEEWSKTFGGDSQDYAYSVQELEDGGYILAGTTESFGAGRTDGWMIKTDSNGTEQWNKTFGGPYTDNFYSVRKTTDKGFLLAGITQPSSDYNDIQAWLMKTDSEGQKEWEMNFGGQDDDSAAFAQETREGEYILAGRTSSYGMVSDVWLIKVGSDKNMTAKLDNNTAGF
ncbi:hypothetical protein EO95_15425 [Methanosarcina sp. 1.H.T.1A.1]|uniref:hypothetical protein n=1 Tax=Methanosarcina sp. 1.H.T.1A.1 TaxID=1483602 RepID=UPI000622B2B5|nr:hypothetical protein [Methanosarcina sp. 1.H.T.1A.1]KKH91992.1 hypothetical protein EO95_15425 [Methanosarcina sp. 1.H.T.1A.1]